MDLNSRIRSLPGLIGRGILAGSQGPDTELEAVLETHNLVLLNTWGRASTSKCHTFQNGEVFSQLDFLGTRRLTVDATAKQAVPASMCLVPWRNGPKHRPVFGSVKWIAGWACAKCEPVQHRFSLSDMKHHIQHNTPLAAKLKDEVENIICRHAQSVDLTTLNAETVAVCQQLFPKKPTVRQRPGQSPAVLEGIQAMWQAYESLCAPLPRGNLQRGREAFARQHQFQQRSHELRKLSRQARKDWLVRMLQEAEQAAAKHNLSEVYRIINQIAPRSRREPVRIRTASGHLQTKQQEYHDIYQYFSTAFGGSAPASTTSCVARRQPTQEEVELAIASLKGGKAVPKASMPADVWKLTSSTMSAHFTQILHTCQHQKLQLPAEIADCELSLLPKPGKVSRRPQDLRPLGLQNPSAKVYAIILRNRLLEVVHRRLLLSTQYAYCPGKSIDQAISRVAQHCYLVRERVKAGVLSVHQRRSGCKESTCYGGIMISLDLSRAFDCLTRQALASALASANVPPDLSQAIIDIHNQCRYKVAHHRYEGRFDMKVGVRQGRALSPMRYSLYTIHLIERVAARTSEAWAREFFTAFADDKHLAWRIERVEDLEFVCRCVRITFELLEQDGMSVNPAKSKLVMALRGSAAKRWHSAVSTSSPQSCFYGVFRSGGVVSRV